MRKPTFFLTSDEETVRNMLLYMLDNLHLLDIHKFDNFLSYWESRGLEFPEYNVEEE